MQASSPIVSVLQSVFAAGMVIPVVAGVTTAMRLGLKERVCVCPVDGKVIKVGGTKPCYEYRCSKHNVASVVRK